MDKSVFDRHHIQFDTEAKTQKEAFHVIAHAAYEAGYVKDENAYFEGMSVKKRRQPAFRMGSLYRTASMRPA